jgi:MFS family permease
MIFVAMYVRLRVSESPVFRALERTNAVERSPIRHALRRHPRNFLIGIGAHIGDTAVVYIYATFIVSYVTNELDLERWVALTGVIMFGCVVIVLQPVYGALSDRIGRRPLNLFSVVFTAAFAVPFFLLVDTRQPVLIWLALVVATGLGFAPMIAVQPAFYAELFGANVRYTGFAASREIGAMISGFSPLVSGILLGAGGGEPWLIALWMIVVSGVSFIAFLASAESRQVDIAR